MQYSCTYCSNNIARSDQNQLFCSSCQVTFPLINDLIFFTESSVNYSKSIDNQPLIEKINFSKRDYELFLKEKSQKAFADLYAAFQPFNESSRAFEPFIPFLKQHLKPNDVILDTWCRTGWSALYLSAHFPDQKIISVWEGNKGVLGYKGFSYWFEKSKRPDNLEIIFADINHKLPLPDKSIKLVYALDTLHRYQKPNIINEFLRITGDDGFVMFPHVHLANNDPDPFFERGGDILHGKEWDYYLGNILKNHSRKHFIFSEPALFEKPDQTEFLSTPDMEDYNGLVCIFPENKIPAKLEKWDFDQSDLEEQFVYLNPMLEINYSTSLVKLNPKKWDSSVEHMLNRHPVYHKKLNKIDQAVLDELTLKICYLSRHRYSIKQIAIKLNLEVDAIKPSLIWGIENDLFRVYPLKNKTNFLQFYHNDQQWKPESRLCTFSNLWKDSVESYSENILLRSEKDESEFTYSEINSAVQTIASKLRSSGLQKGDSVLLFSNISEEFLLCSWASWLAGCIVVAVNPELSIEDKLEIIERVQPSLIFIDPSHSSSHHFPDFKKQIISFSSDSDTGAEPNNLGGWIQSEGDSDNFIPVNSSPDDIACILFTSGTTSKSKAVVLTHEALFNSSLELSRLFKWASTDVILNLGDSYTMSGLRNPTWASLQNGSSVLVIPMQDKKFPQKISEDIFKWKATVFGCVPEMIRILSESSDIASPKYLKSLKQIICTGSYLPESVRLKFEEQFQKPVLNYYGLTETCGLCAGHEFSDSPETNDSIGKSTDSIMQVVNENGDVLSENSVGLLRVFSTNLMTGYLNDLEATKSMLINGWLYTGDLASIDEKGFIYLKGRQRDIIKLKDGNLIYPDSIENVLLENIQISEAAVTSISSGDEKEKVIAFVKLKSESLSDDLTYQLKLQVLSKLGNNFVPDIFIQSDELPKGVNGKILKKVLREMYESNK